MISEYNDPDAPYPHGGVAFTKQIKVLHRLPRIERPKALPPPLVVVDAGDAEIIDLEPARRAQATAAVQAKAARALKAKVKAEKKAKAKLKETELLKRRKALDLQIAVLTRGSRKTKEKK